MRGVRRVFRLSLLRPSDVDRDVDEELEFHLAMREETLRAEGLSARDAARIARQRFGDLDDIRAECLREGHTLARTERAMQLLDGIRNDISFALRSLRRAKGFTAAVVLTLALGIGANATIFAIINSVVLRPVSGVARSSELFELGEVVSYPAFRELRERLPSIGFAGIRERRIALGHGGGGAEQTMGGIVSGNFFALTGATAAIGRTLNERDDVAGAPPAGVVSHDYWTTALGGDRSVVGQVVTVNGAAVAIVGVASPDFRGMHLGATPAIWVPIHVWPVIAPSSMRESTLASRNWQWISVVGRSGAGMTMAQMHSAIATARRGIDPTAGREAIEERSTPRPAQTAALASDARDPVVRFIAILAGMGALVLLTACANIAGLLLSRAAYREREIAVRIALGAGRGRLVRQLLTESLMLAAAGGATGIGVFVGARALLAGVTLPGGILGSTITLGLDARLVAFAVAITIVTGLLVGLAPALQSSRADTVSALKGSASKRGSRQHALRGALVTAQVAVGLVLLVGTGLFARALTRAFAIDLGFRPEPLVMVSVNPGLAQLDAARSAAYFEAVTTRAAAVPGVRGVTWTSNALLDSDLDRENATIPGYTPRAGERVSIEWSLVGARYHEVMGIPMMSGRGFDERDAAGAQPVIVINETVARRYFAGRSAVGSYITMSGAPRVVIGVARDAKYHALNEPPRPYAYLPMMQLAGSVGGSPTLIARVSGRAAPMLRPIVKAVVSANPSVPVSGAETATHRLRTILAPQLAGAWLLGVFSALALVVAAVGIYGIVAYVVSQRTREIGIRMALGARGASVVRLVVGTNLLFIALGIPIGIALAILLARGMTRFLFGVGSSDFLVLAMTSAVMIVVGAIASFIPARRAVRVDPLLALRSDT